MKNVVHSISNRALIQTTVDSVYHLIIVWCCWLLVVPSALAVNQQQQLKQLQNSITQKEQQVKLHQQQRQQLQKQLQTQEQSIADMGEKLYSTQQALQQVKQQVADLEKNIQQSQQQQQQQRALLNAQLNFVFRQGQHSQWQWLLDPDREQHDRLTRYFSYLNQSREQTIEKLQQTQTKLQQQQQALRQQQQQQQQLLQQQQQQQQRLKTAQQNRQQTLDQLDKTLAKNQQQLASLRQNAQQLQQQIAQAEQAARERARQEAQQADQIKQKAQQTQQQGGVYHPTPAEKSLMARTGGLGRPAHQLVWPVRGHIRSRFADQRYDQVLWTGMVIDSPQGTQVKAIASGRVLLVSWLQGYGLVLVLDHGKGDMSIYGYTQSALVKAGSQVTAGQPIALVGNSGGQSRSALYFEIRRQGKPVNPAAWLSQ